MTELQGLIVPLVTPFDAAGRINPAGLRSVADRALEHGANGLMLTALTGEGNLLSADETAMVWKTVIPQYRDRVPVIPAIFSTTTADAIRMGNLALDFGASAVMVAAIMPELYGRRAGSHVRRFFDTFCAAVPLPVILFNYPSLAGYDLTPELVSELADIDGIGYIKESTSDSRRVSEILSRTNHRMQVICGSPDVALESLALGCKTWITAIMNIVPAACHELIATIERGNLEAARRLNSRVIRPAFEMLRKSSNTIGTIKAGLFLRDLDVGVPRPPGLPLEIDVKLRSEFEQLFRAERELTASTGSQRFD